MAYSDETLSAFIDGELPSEEAATIETAQNADPALRERIARLRRADETVRAAYSEAAEGPIPEKVLQLLKTDGDRPPSEQGAEIVPFPVRLARRAAANWPTALAASLALVIGYGASDIFDPTGTHQLASADGFRVDGAISPAHPMFAALETGRSAQVYKVGTDGGLSVEPVLSFEAEDGGYCREFLAYDAATRVHGVACRGAQTWNVNVAVKSPALTGAQAGYTTASAQGDRLIGDFVGRAMTGEAFDEDAEKALIDKGWQ